MPLMSFSLCRVAEAEGAEEGQWAAASLRLLALVLAAG